MEIKSFFVTIDKNVSYTILPYEKQWPMETYLRELHAEPYNYLYKDIFLYSRPYINRDYLIEMKVDPEEMKNKPGINMSALSNSNPVYLGVSSIGSVAQVWVMDAEWEMHSIDYKPDWVKGKTSSTLVFDKYNIHVLNKIISITPIEEIKDTKTSAKAMRDPELKLKKR